MAEEAPPAAKRQRTSSDDPPYELVYWPGIPGRGEFVRLAFVATSTPFHDVGNETKDGIKQLLSLIDASNLDIGGSASNVPPLAPPILRHGDVVLSQTPAILSYLAPQLGLAPEDPVGAARVLALALTALDGFSSEAHDTHHPVASSKTYEEQKEEAKARAADYRTVRLPKFLGYFERVLSAKRENGDGWLYGDKMTFADLVLFQGINGASHAFPKAFERLRGEGKYERVWELYEKVQAIASVKTYLESERRMKYGTGIWRHYAELDDE